MKLTSKAAITISFVILLLSAVLETMAYYNVTLFATVIAISFAFYGLNKYEN